MNAALESARDPSRGAVTKRLLDVVDYHRMAEAGIFGPEERVELIEGVIVTVPPIGSEHAGLVMHLTRLLVDAVGDRGIVNVQNPVRLSRHSEPEPDLALLRPRADFYRTAHPTPADTLLAIEVSHPTLAYDRDVKAPLYARHGIAELWLFDVQAGCVTVYREPERGRYAHEVVHAPPDTLRPVLLPDVAIELAGLLERP